MMDIATLVELGIDAKTAALIWFAVIYQKRLTAIETMLISLIDDIKKVLNNANRI